MRYRTVDIITCLQKFVDGHLRIGSLDNDKANQAMASTSSFPGLLAGTSSMQRRICSNCFTKLLQNNRPSGVRLLSTSNSRSQDGSTATAAAAAATAETPRWAYIPAATRAPVRLHGRGSGYEWKVNTDPHLLDKMYNRFLGVGGDKMLTDEVKWLAVTHKSFDQGRRGFNDRLAFFGGSFSLSVRPRFLDPMMLMEVQGAGSLPCRSPWL